jgi:Ca2+-binding RTX toxin-like protein
VNRVSFYLRASLGALVLAGLLLVTIMVAKGLAGPSTGNPCDVNRHDGTRSVIVGTNGNDELIGGTGDDTICGGNGGDFIQGGSGDDSLHGNHGNDTVWGGPGDDFILGGKGSDKVVGGAGYDTCGVNFVAGGTYRGCEEFVDPA